MERKSKEYDTEEEKEEYEEIWKGNLEEKKKKEEEVVGKREKIMRDLIRQFFWECKKQIFPRRGKV